MPQKPDFCDTRRIPEAPIFTFLIPSCSQKEGHAMHRSSRSSRSSRSFKHSPDLSAFLRGSLLLTLSGVAAKLCGALFRLPLTALLGGTGMGYYSTAYGLFLPLYAVLVTGLSTAVARPVAGCAGRGDFAGAVKIRRTARWLFLVTGLLGTAAALMGARGFTVASTGSADACPAVLMIAPAILLCSLTAVERGYYEGLCDMRPTAVSQAVEAVCKLVLGLWLCQRFLREPPAVLARCPRDVCGACGAVLGVTLSSLGGWLCVLPFGWRRGRISTSSPLSTRDVLRELYAVLIPVSLGALVTNLTSLLDLVTVMRMLPKGEDPAFVYGSFMGMAVAVFSLVPSLTNLLAKGVLPCAAQAWAKGDRAQTAALAANALSLTGLVSLPAGCGIFVLARGCLEFLFAGRDAEIAASYQSLQALAPAVICLCLTYPAFSLLQAIGKAQLPVYLMLPALAVKLAGNLLLVPKYGVMGAGISTSLCYAVILTGALLALRRALGEPLQLRRFLLPQSFSALACASAAWVVYGRMIGHYPQRIAFLCAAGAGGCAYFGTLLLVRSS